jgi:hypothetical protein
MFLTSTWRTLVVLRQWKYTPKADRATCVIVRHSSAFEDVLSRMLLFDISREMLDKTQAFRNQYELRKSTTRGRGPD